MMKIRVIQPPYPKIAEDTGLSVSFMIEQLRQCDDSLDLILLPECCNAPSGCGDSCLLERLVQEFTQPLLDAAKETAIRCQANVGINLYVSAPGSQQVRNATLLFDRQGQLVFQYDKQHLPASEYYNPLIDHSYLKETLRPICAEIEGVRYAFLTCYDIYYTEFIHRLALEKPDVIILCSLQRGERADILEVEAKNCAFLCNAYLVRSSYHMGPGHPTGGCSMVVAPDGLVLHNFQQELGSFDCEISDIHYKYSRANGFGQPPVTNDRFQTLFRSPWCYRVGGSGVKPTDREQAYPRISALRGFPQAAPENSLPAIALAVSLGADETALDVQFTADHVPVLSRSKDIKTLTLSQLRSQSLGSGCYEGLQLATLEEVMAAFPRRILLDLHLLPEDGNWKERVRAIRVLAEAYDCPEHICFSSSDPEILAAAREVFPEAARWLTAKDFSGLVETAAGSDCTGVHLAKLPEDPTILAALKKAGLRWSVAGEDAAAAFAAGADVLRAENCMQAALSK